MLTDKKWLSLCSKEKNDRMALGYAYPAYECFKAVEMNKPEIELLRFWCQYWILVTALTIFERVGDIFISWLPMYSEAKLAFFVYLWFPKTRGTTYVYESFLRPYVAKHETEIDRNLMELRTRAGDLIVIYWQKAATYGQTRIFEVLQYVASQSPSAHQPPPQQQQQQQSGVRRPPPPDPSARPPPDPSTCPPAELSNCPPATSQQSQHSTLRTTSTSAATSKQQEPSNNADSPSSKQPAAFHQAWPPAQSEPESCNQQPATLKKDTTQSSDTLSVTNGNGSPSPREIIMEEAIRVTRGRLRRTQAPTNP